MEWDNLQLLRRSFFETRGGEIETKYKDIWTLDLNFNRDVLAGMLAIVCELVENINDTIEHEDLLFGLNKVFEFTPIYVISDFDDSYHFDSSYTKKEIYPPNGSYGICIKSFAVKDFNMYIFKHPGEFMQGLITVANNFGVDFRDYIASLPLDSEGIYYDLPEYHVAEYLARHN